jgi:hypothetical protein
MYINDFAPVSFVNSPSISKSSYASSKTNRPEEIISNPINEAMIGRTCNEPMEYTYRNTEIAQFGADKKVPFI